MNNHEKWLNLHSNKKHQPLYPHEIFVTFTFKNFTRSSKILDLGCGGGRHVKFLAENGFETYGCDYSENGIKITNELLKENNLKADLKVASVDKLPYDDNFFDGLICFGVLYYNDKDTIEKSAKEIYRILKNDAKALIVVRTLNDYRYKDSIKKDKYSVIIKETNPKRSAYAENDMNMYFFDENEVNRIFSIFKNIEINTYEISHENGLIFDSNYLITLQK